MSSYSVSRSAVIAAPAEEIYPFVASFREWTKWSPWESIDPGMQRSYDGPVSGVGAKYMWRGNSKAGAGTMEIVDAAEPSMIGIRLDFTKPMKAVNPTTFTFAPEGAGTRVTWTMTGENKSVMTRIFALFVNMDKMVGKDFEKGLASLAATVAAARA
jgi:Polyketide cyclase / dehydrase and lipid transport